MLEARQQRLAILRLLGAIELEERPADSSSSPASTRTRRAAKARWAQRDRFDAIRGGRS
jgi:hypothetical protein